MNLKQTHTKLIVLSILLGIGSLSTAHAARLYQIDLILFLNKNAAGIHSEHWPGEITGPDTSGALSLQQARPPGSAYSQVDAKYRKLTAERRQLDRSNRYQTLLHLAWLQPAARGNSGKKLYFELPSAGGGPPKLRGTIRIKRGRYLHAELDAIYRKRIASANGSSDTESVSFRLQENRRMRRNELHYLDHPAIGALMTATPISSGPTEPQEEASTIPAAEASSAPEPN